jgi:two-component system, chemotaxis family, chemotaxis protein CheY
VNLAKYHLIRKCEYCILIMSKLILIVEDDVDLIEIYKEILELHEFDVETALNGEEGVKKYIEKRPSLVIMDGDMPILDGYEAFKQIKKIDNTANVIIVTGFSEFEPKSQEAVKEGLMKVISKPLGIEQLLELAGKYTEIQIKE